MLACCLPLEPTIATTCLIVIPRLIFWYSWWVICTAVRSCGVDEVELSVEGAAVVGEGMSARDMATAATATSKVRCMRSPFAWWS